MPARTKMVQHESISETTARHKPQSYTGRTSENLLGIGIGEQVGVGRTLFLEELPEDDACPRHSRAFA